MGHWNDERPSCSVTAQPAQPSTTSPQPLRGAGVIQPWGQACRYAPPPCPSKDTTTRRVTTTLQSRSGFKSCSSQAGREGTCRAASMVASAGSGSPQPTFPRWPRLCECPRRMEDAWSLPLAPGCPEPPMRALLVVPHSLQRTWGTCTRVLAAQAQSFSCKPPASGAF